MEIFNQFFVAGERRAPPPAFIIVYLRKLNRVFFIKIDCVYLRKYTVVFYKICLCLFAQIEHYDGSFDV